MKQKALFLDRDGIINVDHGYIYRIEDFEFTDGIFGLVKLFVDLGYLIFVVTNQSGIRRGYYSEEDFRIVTEWMINRFEQHDIRIEEVQYCPHRPEENCRCRKPETGMIEQASKTYPLDLKNSWMIGDKESDIQLAENAGIGHTIYIGDKKFPNSTLSFPSVTACRKYFQENQDKILTKAANI